MVLSIKNFEQDPKKWSKTIIKDFCWYRTLTPDFIDKYAKYLDLDTILQSHPATITEDIIRKHGKKWPEETWKKVFYKKDNLSDKFLREFANHKYFCWEYVCQFQKNLTEQFIEDYEDKVHWGTIFGYQCLNSDFLRKHFDKIKTRQDWVDISATSDLDEQFILEFKDKVCWEHILRNQRITPVIITECADYINFNELLNDVNAYGNYKHTEYALRIIFNYAPTNVRITNWGLWKGKLSLGFVREFAEFFPKEGYYFVKKRDHTDKVKEEFVKRMKKTEWDRYGI